MHLNTKNSTTWTFQGLGSFLLLKYKKTKCKTTFADCHSKIKNKNTFLQPKMLILSTVEQL